MSQIPPSVSLQLPLSAKGRRTREAPISALMAAALKDSQLINLAVGLVDPATLPVEDCAQIARKIFGDERRGRAALQYDTTLGLRPLRQAVLEHLETLEGRPASSFSISADDILITTGSQQTLYLIADVLVDPGDIVITANPSYFVFAGVLQSLGAHVLTVPMDEQGMDVDAVERLLARLALRGTLPKFIYVTSFYDNPTGLTLSLPRRKRLLELARRFSINQRLLIVEDAAYRELRYDGEGLASIKSLDPDNQYTVLTQTFSKPFSPGLKVGYTAMPRDLLEAVLVQKGSHDFGSASVCQHIALEAMRDGTYAQHVEVLKREYRRKRDAMLSALEKYFGTERGFARWTRPHGGLYVWVTLPEAIDASGGSELFRKCVDRGVLYVPGEYCFQPDEGGHLPKNHLRLSFGQVAYEQIEEGVAKLAGVVTELAQSEPDEHSEVSALTPTLSLGGRGGQEPSA
jgi:2-aminoadipate transaminase